MSKQLVEITSRLEEILPEDASEEDVAGKARLLDELLDLVESIDQAKDLSTVGGLGTLLRVIEGNEGRPGLQSRRASSPQWKAGSVRLPRIRTGGRKSSYAG